jgi:hypothetical protein
MTDDFLGPLVICIVLIQYNTPQHSSTIQQQQQHSSTIQFDEGRQQLNTPKKLYAMPIRHAPTALRQVATSIQSAVSAAAIIVVKVTSIGNTVIISIVTSTENGAKITKFSISKSFTTINTSYHHQHKQLLTSLAV